MAVSLYGAFGKKVGKIELETGTTVLAYAADDVCLFGVVMVMTQPRHYAVTVLSQTGLDAAIVGKPLVIRLSRNENEMTSQLPSVTPVAAVHEVADILEVWWVDDEGERAQLQERVDLVRSVTGQGGGLGISPQPPPQVKRFG